MSTELAVLPRETKHNKRTIFFCPNHTFATYPKWLLFGMYYYNIRGEYFCKNMRFMGFVEPILGEKHYFLMVFGA